MSTDNPMRQIFAAQPDTFSLLGPMRSTPYAVGERGPNSRIRLMPMLSGVDAMNSLQDYYPMRLQDSQMGVKQAVSLFLKAAGRGKKLQQAIQQIGDAAPASSLAGGGVGGNQLGNIASILEKAKKRAVTAPPVATPAASSVAPPQVAPKSYAGPVKPFADKPEGWQPTWGAVSNPKPPVPKPIPTPRTAEMQDLVDAVQSPPLNSGPVVPPPARLGPASVPASTTAPVSPTASPELATPVDTSPVTAPATRSWNISPRTAAKIGAGGVATGLAAGPVVEAVNTMGSAASHSDPKAVVQKVLQQHGNNVKAPHNPEAGPTATAIANAPANAYNYVKDNGGAAFDWLKQNWKTVAGVGGVGLAALLAYHLWKKKQKPAEDEEDYGPPVKFAGLDMTKAIDNQFVLGFLTQCARYDSSEELVREKIAMACSRSPHVLTEFEKCAFGGGWNATASNFGAPSTIKPPEAPIEKINFKLPEVQRGQSARMQQMRQQAFTGPKNPASGNPAQVTVAPTQDPAVAKHQQLMAARQAAHTEAAANPTHAYWSTHSPEGSWKPGTGKEAWPERYGHFRTGEGFNEDWQRFAQGGMSAEAQAALKQMADDTGLAPDVLGRSMVARDYLRHRMPTLDRDALRTAQEQFNQTAQTEGQPPAQRPEAPTASERYRAYYSMPEEYRDALTQFQSHQINRYKGGTNRSPDATYSPFPSIGDAANHPGDWIMGATPDRAHEQFDAKGMPRVLDPEAYVNMPELADRYGVNLRDEVFRDWWAKQQQQIEQARVRQGELGTPEAMRQYEMQDYKDPQTLMASYWNHRDGRKQRAWDAQQGENRAAEHFLGYRRMDPRTNQEVMTTGDRIGDNDQGLWGASKDTVLSSLSAPVTLASGAIDRASGGDGSYATMGGRGVMALPNYIMGSDIGHNVNHNAAPSGMRPGEDMAKADIGQNMATTRSLFSNTYDPLTGGYKPSDFNSVGRGFAMQADDPENSAMGRIGARGMQSVMEKSPDLLYSLALTKGVNGLGGKANTMWGAPLYRAGMNQIDPFSRNRGADGSLSNGQRWEMAKKDLASNAFLPVTASPMMGMVQQTSDEFAPTRYMFDQLPNEIRANTTYNPDASGTYGTIGELTATGLEAVPFLLADRGRGFAGKQSRGVLNQAARNTTGSTHNLFRQLASGAKHQQAMGQLSGSDVGVAGLPAVGHLAAASRMNDEQLRASQDYFRHEARTPWKDRMQARIRENSIGSVQNQWAEGGQVDPDRLQHFLKQVPQSEHGAWTAYNKMNPQMRGLVNNMAGDGNIVPAIEAVAKLTPEQIQQATGKVSQTESFQAPNLDVNMEGFDPQQAKQFFRQLPPQKQQEYLQFGQQITEQAMEQYAKQYGGDPKGYLQDATAYANQLMRQRLWMDQRGGMEKQQAWQQRLRTKIAVSTVLPGLPPPKNPLTPPPPASAPAGGSVPQPAAPAPTKQPALQPPAQPAAKPQPQSFVAGQSPAATPAALPPAPAEPTLQSAGSSSLTQPVQAGTGTPSKPVPPPVATDGSPYPPATPSQAPAVTQHPAGAITPAGAAPVQSESLLDRGFSMFDKLTGGMVSSALKAPPEQQAAMRGEIESFVTGNEQMTGVVQQLAQGKAPASPEQLNQSALSKVQAATGLDVESAWNTVQDMDMTQKALLFGGLGLGAVGLITAMTSEEGGILPWLMALAGLGGAAYSASDAGLLGQGAQDLTHGIKDTVMGGAKPKVPEWAAKSLSLVPDAMLPGTLSVAARANPELTKHLDRAIGHGSWGNSALSFMGDVTGQTNAAFQQAGIAEKDVPRVLEAWRQHRSHGTSQPALAGT